MLKNAALLAVLCWPLAAQWKVSDKGIPRSADGKPNLSAPAPRRADGKPDLTGIWIADPPKVRDATVGLKPGEVSMTPWAQKVFDERKTGDFSATDPDANCLPQGVPKINSTPIPFKIFQEPNVVVILYEAFDQYRQIFMDGRPIPKDANPQWFGYSVGKWDGDTLAVESSGFNGKAWLDQLGHPSTDALHVIERFHRRDFGHMDIVNHRRRRRLYQALDLHAAAGADAGHGADRRRLQREQHRRAASEGQIARRAAPGERLVKRHGHFYDQPTSEVADLPEAMFLHATALRPDSWEGCTGS